MISASEFQLPLQGVCCHVALNIADPVFEATLDFYTRLLGMEIDWQPDKDNVYLSLGSDNFALHRVASNMSANGSDDGLLDHIGFVLFQMAEVDATQVRLSEAGVVIVKSIKTHRDGSRSFYCRDPAGTLVQFLFHPRLSEALASKGLHTVDSD